MQADLNMVGDVSRARDVEARAPFALRCGALLVDYTVVIGIAAFATLLARMFGATASGWISSARSCATQSAILSRS